MATQAPASSTAGTVSNRHSGRRAEIADLLRHASEPLSVEDVGRLANVHVNTARFHLEALVEAGLAVRATEPRGRPGRRRVLYTGVLPNHEPARSYQLLASMLTAALAHACPDVREKTYEVGQEWGRFLTSRPAPFEAFDEEDIDTRLVDKLDQLWFAAEFCPLPAPRILLHNCPFIETALQAPSIVCELHAGMINGSLEDLRSARRIVELHPQAEPHLCWASLGDASDPVESVPLVLPDDKPTPED